MTQIEVNDFVHENIGESIIITGLPRSGTTILGKLVGSFDGVEYGFEPPLVPYLDAKCRHGLLDTKTAVEHLKIYLFYDYFAEFLHGRRYNFRPGDASNVLGMQTTAEVFEKWNHVSSMDDALDIAPGYSFCFKSPGVYSILAAVFASSQDIRVVDIGRNLDRVLASLVGKRWFFDENLGPESTGFWPFHDVNREFMVPYLVDETDIKAWQTMTPETRTVYICNQLAEDRISFQEQYADDEGYHDIRYEQLIDKPATVAEQLAEIFDGAWGAMTDSVVDEITPTSAPADVSAVLDECDDKVEERLRELRPAFEP